MINFEKQTKHTGGLIITHTHTQLSGHFINLAPQNNGRNNPKSRTLWAETLWRLVHGDEKADERKMESEAKSITQFSTQTIKGQADEVAASAKAEAAAAY